MTVKDEKWYAVSVTVPPEYADAVEFAFNALDSLGSDIDLLSKTDTGMVVVNGYFASPPDGDTVQDELDNASRIHGLPADTEFRIERRIVENRDWLAEWKKYWKPVEIGRFVIAAPWHDVDAESKIVIRIEPNMAFGTGTHETTQLCLEAISDNLEPNRSFLDVGTGTGILAIAAALMSDGRGVEAIDTDADAVEIARDNAAMNGVADRINFSAGSITPRTGRFDFVCANLTADVIVPILPTLIAKTDEILVLSGILAEQEESVLRGIPDALPRTVARRGEWISVTVRVGFAG